jgi:hypothetical protein
VAASALLATGQAMAAGKGLIGISMPVYWLGEVMNLMVKGNLLFRTVSGPFRIGRDFQMMRRSFISSIFLSTIIRSAPRDQPTLSIGNPHPVAYDSKREQMLVPN